MLRYLPFLLLLSPGLRAQNLLANGSFQDRNICTEYNDLCGPEGWFYITKEYPGTYSKKGNYYETISLGVPQNGMLSGSWMYSRILCRLQKDAVYQFEITINTRGQPFLFLDVWMGTPEPARADIPQDLPSPNFTLLLSHQVDAAPEWKRYVYTYTANGNEDFILIGNMHKSPLSPGFAKAAKETVYLIDNISLVPADPAIKICPEYSIQRKLLYDMNHRHPTRRLTESNQAPHLH